MSSHVPTVLLSSTCYDLNQVRADLFGFVKNELGYLPLASEFTSFPIDPGTDTVENCRKRVKEQTDILVLIIGSRYGSVDGVTGKSITNLEYLEARVKRVPIYVFIENRTLTLYESWKAAPQNNFEALVDNPKIFEFVRRVREEDKEWTMAFNRADDIIAALRNQFAFLFFKCLVQRNRLIVHEAPNELEGLTGAAYRIGLERPPGWEYRLFSQTLNDELQRRAEERQDYEHAFVVGAGEKVDVNSIGIITQKMDELIGVSAQMEKLINSDFREAVGKPGEQGDLRKIRRVTRRLGELYAFALKWTQDSRRLNFADIFQDAKIPLCKFASDFISQIETLARESARALDGIDEKLARKEKVVMKLEMVLKVPGIDEFREALGRGAERAHAGRH